MKTILNGRALGLSARTPAGRFFPLLHDGFESRDPRIARIIRPEKPVRQMDR
jgi:hypothetical protein